jgi:3'-5' exonuclease
METQDFYGEDLDLSGQTSAPAEPCPSGVVNLVVDIETIPGPERPDPSTLTPPANYKKPETIAAWQEENADKVYRQQALDPMQGRICSVAWCFEDLSVRSVTVGVEAQDEGELFEQFTAAILAGYRGREIRWIGHNLDFDLGFLWKRSFKYPSAAFLRGLIPRERWSKQLIDTLRLWQFGRELVGLGDLAEFLGLEGKTGSGSEVWDMYQAGQFEEIGAYNRQDVALTRQIYGILAGPSCN